MAAYRLLIKASAGRELDRLGSKSDRRRIVERIQALADDPRPRGCEKLAGYADRFRIRQGNYRVVYLVDDHRREVTVFKVGDRKDVYR
ncbi:MAG: type II toxin-antitoxin system RelE/ParE family toxin [Steroidobacteraceae bacterium]